MNEHPLVLGKMREVMVGGVPIDTGPTVFTMRWIFEQLFDDAGFSLGDVLTLKPADAMDKVGNKAARAEIAMIKVVAPNMALQVIDWAMQVHGGAGMCQDFPLAYAWAHARTLRFADGPDEVHRNAIAKIELGRHAA